VSDDDLSPVMRQYVALKSQYPDAILLFRMGDFYEMFYEDAIAAAPVLQITLTTRDKNRPNPIPMCGVPYHALDTYLARLLRHNLKAAVCEQVEEPGQSKGPVRREIVRIVTPGTIVEENLLPARENNFIGAALDSGRTTGGAVLDISTADFIIAEFSGELALEQLAGFFQSFGLSELVLPDSHKQPDQLLKQLRLPADLLITTHNAWAFDSHQARQRVLNHLEVGSLAGFGAEGKALAVSAAGGLLDYLRETQKNDLAHIQSLRLYHPESELVLDAATVRNLELVQRMADGKREGTLLDLLDQTRTALGARRIREWLLHPLRDLNKIRQRQDRIEVLIDDSQLRTAISAALADVHDLERLNSRINMDLANPRDLVALRSSLELLPHLASFAGLIAQRCRVLRNERGEGVPGSPLVSDGGSRVQDPAEPFPEEALPAVLPGLAELADEIGRALVDSPPLSLRDGGVIREGYRAEADELRRLKSGAQEYLAGLESRERSRTGIDKLRIGYNKIFGYFIEISKAAARNAPAEYIRKQTLVNAERFITPELKEYEERILGAEERLIRLEQELFQQLRAGAAKHSRSILAAARAIANLDALTALAETAKAYGYCRPDIDDQDALTLEESRHPVIERILLREPFVPNDLLMDCDDQQIIIITGPNMAGKSTFIRQVALCVLMAQMGSFIPAKRARIGLVDRIFTRVGATDNLYGGMSTFMMEMSETANILHHATRKSLIILDEIGRGTSTFDGLSIAWAVTEYLHDELRLGAKTLFATHYHELTEIATTLPRVRNYTVQVKEWNDTIVFLRKIKPGNADRSYGIQVARLAGLPRLVITRAKEILSNLEKVEFDAEGRPVLAQSRSAPRTRRKSALAAANALQLSLFTPAQHPVLSRLGGVDLDDLSPRAALDLLYELKRIADGTEVSD